MARTLKDQATFSYAGGLSEKVLQHYLPSDLAKRLCRAEPEARTFVEAYAHLSSARYAVSTYLPHHLIARQITTHESGPWLEWVEGSLLFADVSGSTALAERLSTLGREGIEIVTSVLNDFFEPMIRIIQQANGDLLTFGGDALLVLFSGPDHALVATHTALTLLDELSNFERSIAEIGAFHLSMHIGVESGRVALISAGQSDSPRYSAMGYTVNNVARAEGYGNRGDLVVGPNTWGQISASADGEEVAPGYMHIRTLHNAPSAAAELPQIDSMHAHTSEALSLVTQELAQLSIYLPEGLLSRILADPQRPRIEADLRPVTVLFAQIIGLEPLIEALPPNTAATLVDRVVRAMQDAVKRFGGVINKLDLADEGSKLLAIFGAPIAYEDHAERTARAALAMIDALADVHNAPRKDLADQTSLPLADITIRIGINTGSVFAGNVGSADRKEYTVMGDAVNVAARVMGQTAWDEVWCSESTAASIDSRLEFANRGYVRVRGKSEPLRLLKLVGERAQTDLIKPNQAPLVGRQAELQQLRSYLKAVSASQGQVVRINGEAGLGKSRLAAALIERPRAQALRIVQVTCFSFLNTTPFAPWSEILKEICDIASGDSQSLRETKLKAALARLGADQTEWLPLLADLIRLETAETTLTRALEPQQRQIRRFELITDLLFAAAQNARHAPAGMLLIFEDLHWADQASLDLWQYVAAHIAKVPLYLLGLHRPQLSWGRGDQGDGAHIINLDELPPDDSDALLESHLNGVQIPPGLRDHIIRRADGNPLFLEELARAVVAQFQAGSDTEALDVLAELPDSLNGLLLARIDRLNETSRALLRIAAVIGLRFPFGVLQAIHPVDQQALLHELTNLDEQTLTLLEREIPERVHTFRHALVQEVAYQSLLYSRRRELHRRIGEYLARRYTDDLIALQTYYAHSTTSSSPVQSNLDDVPSNTAKANTSLLFLLAHHYRLSDAPDQAITYLLLAGHAAREAYANDEAIQHYRWVLELLRDQPSNPQTWETREALGDVLCTIGRYDEALEEYAAVLACANVDNDMEQGLPPNVAAEALRSRGYALEKQGRYADALAALRQAEALVQKRLNDVPPLLVSAISADIGLVLTRRGEYDEALEVCIEGLGRLRRDRRTREDERIEAHLQTQIGTIHGMRGNYAQARFHFENALAAQEAIDNLYGSSILNNNLGYLWQLQGNYEQALEHYLLAEDLAQKINARNVLSGANLNAAYAAYCLGRYAEAEEGCRTALALYEEMRDQAGIAQAYDTLGQIVFNRGDYNQAQEYYTRALELHRKLGSSYEEGNCLTNIAEVAGALGQTEQAYVTARQALEIGERLQATQLQIEALNALAEAQLLAAETDAALDESATWAQRAAALAEALGSRGDYGIAQRLLGQIATRQKRDFGAYFQASLAAFTEIKNRFELARTQARYAEALHACNEAAAITYLKQAQFTFKEIGARRELEQLTILSERSA